MQRFAINYIGSDYFMFEFFPFRVYFNRKSIVSKKIINPSNASFAAFFQKRGSKAGNVQVWDCTLMQPILVDLFTEKQINLDKGYMKYDIKKLVDRYLAGDHSVQDFLANMVCDFIKLNAKYLQ